PGQAVAREGGPGRTRLRDSRGREGGRGACARAQADGARRALGAAARRRGRRGGGARDGADAARGGRVAHCRGVTGYTSRRLLAYATIAAGRRAERAPHGRAAAAVAGSAPLDGVAPVALAPPFLFALAAAVAKQQPEVSVRMSLDRD